MTEILARVVYNEASRRWRDLSTGRFVAEQTVRDELNRHVDAAQINLQSITRQLYAGNITVDQWQIATALEIKEAHMANAMFSVGGRANMTPANWGRVGGTLRDEYRYLTRFANQIAAGQISEAQALARIQQYGNATGQSYWREWERLNDAPEFRNLPSLSRVPQDGSTGCRGNCRCFLERRDDGIWWISPQDEATCGSCNDMADGSPYSGRS